MSGDLTFDNIQSQQVMLFKSIEEAPTHFTVDLSEMVKIDSAGLALMIEGIKRTNKLGKHMQYCNLPEICKKLVAFYDLDSVLRNAISTAY